MKRATFILSSLAICMSATAQEQESLSIQQITEGVLEAVNGYAKAISCFNELATPASVFALTPLKTRDDFFDAKYLAFWTGDVGCNGGSGTMTMNHAVVRVSQLGDFYVDPHHSAPVIDGPRSRFITKYVGNGKDTMVIDQLEHAANDGNNFPSLKYRVTYQIDDRSGKWKIINKKQLPYKP